MNLFTHIRNQQITQWFWGFMCIYFLNISVDAQDPNDHAFYQDVHLNDQESIAELVIEKLLCFENAIQENEDNDTENQLKHKSKTIDLGVVFPIEKLQYLVCITEKKQAFPDYQKRLINPFLTKELPPPKQWLFT